MDGADSARDEGVDRMLDAGLLGPYRAFHGRQVGSNHPGDVVGP